VTGSAILGMHYQRLGRAASGRPSILNNLGVVPADATSRRGGRVPRGACSIPGPDPPQQSGLALARQRRYAEALAAFRKGGSERAALNNLGWATI
jgi:hypothetical protein